MFGPAEHTKLSSAEKTIHSKIDEVRKVILGGQRAQSEIKKTEKLYLPDEEDVISQEIINVPEETDDNLISI